MPQHLYEALRQHLFRNDFDEHGALVLAGTSSTREGLNLLVREVILARDEDFPPGVHGYRQISPRLIAEVAGRAGEENLAYLSAHNHPGATRSVSFSQDDLDAHRRLFPHLLDLTEGRPVGGLVFGEQAVAGEIWLSKDEQVVVDEAVVIGPNLIRLAPGEETKSPRTDERFDRQARLFGDIGQARLKQLHAGVIGAGGGGSLVVEQLAHLGVGALTVVDFDVVSESNLSRIVGAVPHDVVEKRKKVAVLERLIQGVDPSIIFTGVDGDIVDLDVAEQLLCCDVLFLATDTVRARLVFNAIVHRYLIPGVQIGVKVEIASSGEIEEIYVAVRPVFPSQGCLDCAGLIDAFALQREQRSPEEARAQDYVGAEAGEEVIDPSVISLNGISASHAVNVILFAVVALAGSPESLAHRLFFPRDGSWFAVTPRKDPDCLFCGASNRSTLARGGPATSLPCRRSAPGEAAARRGRGWLTRVFHRFASRRGN
jgi:hypothetical protein